MRNPAILFFCVLFAGALLLSCDDSQPVRSTFKDASTFVIVAVGKPKPEETDGLKRRYEARSAALLLAQHEMTVKLKGRVILDQEISETRYDKKDNCALVYTVRLRPDSP
jgi:hypothetical protein